MKQAVKVATVNPAALADRYGVLRAKIADLKKDLEGIRESILNTNLSEIEGNMFRVTVADATRETVNLDKLRAEYPDIVDDFTESTDYVVVRCNAR